MVRVYVLPRPLISTEAKARVVLQQVLEEGRRLLSSNTTALDVVTAMVSMMEDHHYSMQDMGLYWHPMDTAILMPASWMVPQKK